MLLTAQLMSSAKKLDDFPEAKRLWLSNASVEIQPANSRHYNSQKSGYVRILYKDGAEIEKGSVWAVLRPEILELNERMHRLEVLLTQEKIRTMELDHHDKIDGIREDLSELEQQHAKLVAIIDNPQFARNQAILVQTRSTIKLVEEQIARTKKRLDSQLKGSEVDTEIAKLKLEEERRKLELQSERINAEFRAPFSGRVHYHFDHDRDQEPPFTLWFENGDPLASFIDDQHYEIELPDLTIDLSRKETESLIIQISAGDEERSVMAIYDRTEITAVNGATTKKFFFRVNKEDARKAEKILGKKTIASIYSQFDEPCHIVSKGYLLEKTNAEDPTKTNWRTMAKECWPTSEVIAVGNLSLAMRQKSSGPGQEHTP